MVTVLGKSAATRLADRATRWAAGAGVGVASIARLAPPTEGVEAVELVLAAAPDESFHAARLDAARAAGLDLLLERDRPDRRQRTLLVCDMDSTVVEGEGIDELAREAGRGEEVARVTARAMAGELDFAASLVARVACLAGLETEAFARAHRALPLAGGAQRLFREARARGLVTAILSGGFTQLGEPVARSLGADYLVANTLELADGRLTGRLVGELIDAGAKAAHARRIAHEHSLELKSAIGIGDGANDRPMLAAVGLGIAYRGKAALRGAVVATLDVCPLDAALALVSPGAAPRGGGLAEPRPVL